jgi:hypothetical protein
LSTNPQTSLLVFLLPPLGCASSNDDAVASEPKVTVDAADDARESGMKTTTLLAVAALPLRPEDP